MKQICLDLPGQIKQADYVVSVSGGLTSFEALRRTIEAKGRENVSAVFADVGRIVENGETVCGEDDDLYRFLDETERLLDFPIHRIHHREYANMWEAFFGERFMGNSRIDTCSKFLKREVLEEWIDAYHPGCVRVLGFSWLEISRATEYLTYFPNSWFPLTEAPYVTNEDIARWLEDRGIQRPTLYREGFSHNNCGGLCVKGGIGQLHDLYRWRPARYAYNARRETEFRASINPNATIFRKDGEPITLEALGKLFESGYVPKTSQESCGGRCMIPEEAS